MYSDGTEVASKTKQQQKRKKPKTFRKITRKYSIIIVMLFLTVAALFASNWLTFSAYSKLQGNYMSVNDTLKRIENSKLAFESQFESIKASYDELGVKCDSLLAQNEELKKQSDEIKKANEELAKKNKELVDDNVALQNSLKMAASVGIKPQNYTRYDGLTARNDIERGTYLGKFMGTAYTPSKEECGNDKGITHSGKPIIPGISIAVDTKYWPFGTVFYIKGLGYAVAMDTGTGVWGKNRFDFAVFDRSFALTLGQRYWEVYLIRMGNGRVDEIKL